MVSKILNIPFVEKSKYDDMDATAIALCHAYNLSGVPMMSSKKSWDRFIKDNFINILNLINYEEIIIIVSGFDDFRPLRLQPD